MPALARLAAVSWSIALAGCYQPSFPACLVRCSESEACPAGAACLGDGFCHGGGDQSACTDDAGGPPDGAADALQLDAGPCALLRNESPTTPAAIAAGSTCVHFAGLGTAFDATCATSHGRELFFQLDVPTTQIVYADSFGSSGPTTISAWNGACSPVPDGGVCFPDSTCGEPGALAAARLGPGPACLVVEEASAPVDAGFAQLNVVLSGTDGFQAFAGANMVDSCSQSADFSANACSGTGAAPEARWFIPACPTGLNVTVTTTCSPSGRTASMVPRLTAAHDSPNLGCSTGLCGTNPPGLGLGGGARGLVWFIIDGPTTADCGPTTLSVTFN